ncbi:MAG: hypothetical protein HZB38_17530, partial [Planctomycetes bacterium]|nr:hypothetical protein [Planctomycetota bacterium]
SRKLEKAAERFAHHYNSTFLFQVGDEAIEIWPNGVGVLPWASLPLILLGIAVLVRPVGPPESRTATLVWLLLYPAGDILTFHYTANAMRAAPGMGIAAMLTALGMVACWRLLAQRHTRTLRLVAAVAVGFFFVVQTVSFIRYYFVGFPLEKSTRITFHADLVEACEWLRPRRSAFQAIGFTTREFNQPYIVATTVLQTPPQRWHGEPRIFDMTGDWDTYHRVGDLYFLYHQSPDEWLASLRGEGVRGPAALVVRPGETTAGRLIHSIRDPENNPRLEIRAVD